MESANANARETKIIVECLKVRKEMIEDMKRYKTMMKKIESGVNVRQSTIEKSIKRSTKILKKLARLFLKSVPSFMFVFLASHVPKEYRILAYLAALAPVVQLVLKSVANSIQYVITYNVAIPFIAAYHTLAFAVNTVVTLSWSILSVAFKARKLVGIP